MNVGGPTPADEFTTHRALLFTIAYEITGSAADAEDVVSETYLRFAAEDRSSVAHPRAYLARISTRLALNSVRARQRRREDYVGPWLPEPVLTTPDVADDVVLAESVSMAMMLILQSLSPDERAVFLLREVFGFSHLEIADAVGRAEPAVRQIAHRARAAVAARRPRFEPDPQQAEQVRQRFFSAMATGDVQALMDVLAPEVVSLSDGGGQVAAALHPVLGADPVARFMVGLYRKLAGSIEIVPALINGMTGGLLRIDGQLDSVGIIEMRDGLIGAIYIVRNPDKLIFLDRLTPITR